MSSFRGLTLCKLMAVSYFIKSKIEQRYNTNRSRVRREGKVRYLRLYIRVIEDYAKAVKYTRRRYISAPSIKIIANHQLLFLLDFWNRNA